MSRLGETFSRSAVLILPPASALSGGGAVRNGDEGGVIEYADAARSPCPSQTKAVVCGGGSMGTVLPKKWASLRWLRRPRENTRQNGAKSLPHRSGAPKWLDADSRLSAGDPAHSDGISSKPSRVPPITG
jgi:hypothetical protein